MSDISRQICAAASGLAAGGNFLSALRSKDLPRAGEAVGDILSAVAAFSDGNSNDWRVRLSLPTWISFRSSSVLAPLKAAGGLVFPYTPMIKMNQSASYSPVPTTHSNYGFQAYQHSDPGKISITAPMHVEDPVQAAYWLAVLHYLRSATKMFSGYDPKAGNPPPIVYLNGYGGYVFKNVPVVITAFDVTLNEECDYIPVKVSGSLAGEIAGIADSVGGFASTVGGTIAGATGVASAITGIAGGVGMAASALNTFGLGGTTSGGTTHVPTKSSFGITLQPVYSRDSIRKFSLDMFVTGGYLNSGVGYI